MTPNAFSATTLATSRRPYGRWNRLAAVVRWIVMATLTAIVLTVVSGDALPAVARGHAASTARTTERPVAVKCRVVGARVALGLHHHHALHDGSARSAHEREDGDASLGDDLDRDDASHLPRDGAARTSVGRVTRVDESARPRRGAPSGDPSRFATASGLPRGPPV